MSLTADYARFIERYQNNPVLFVREVFGVEPFPDQIELLEAYGRRERRITKRSGHGVGKTASLAWVIIHHILTRFPQKTVCTAPTTKQLFDALAAETKGWINKLPPELKAVLVVKSDSIELAAAPDESFVSFRTSRPDVPEALAGVHSENVLLIGDEASGIPDPIFEGAIGSMSGENATTILAGNPVRSSGFFYDTFHKLRDMWVTLRVSCEGHPNVTPDFAPDVARRYGERSNAYRVRVLGEFPLADDDTVIPFELAEPALQREVTPLRVRPIWGLDCARFGADKSALARRTGNVLSQPIDEWHGLDTMALTGRVVSLYRETPMDLKPEEINVDSIGIGAGVVDRLLELGLPARGINVSEAPALFGDRYLNFRAELWFKGREWLAQRDVNLAGDERLVAELIAPKYKFTSSGKIQIESKEDMKKRLPDIGSPNRADAFLLTLASDAVSAIGGSAVTQRASWKQPLERRIRGVV